MSDERLLQPYAREVRVQVDELLLKAVTPLCERTKRDTLNLPRPVREFRNFSKMAGNSIQLRAWSMAVQRELMNGR
jgi:hypothetical protein